eukprot:jgi/Tetstr1/457259/TSEL_004188.t1
MDEAALNLCEWKLRHNIKTAAFDRLSRLLKTHMLPKDGSELTETWYKVEQGLNVTDIKNTGDRDKKKGKYYFGVRRPDAP